MQFGFQNVKGCTSVFTFLCDSHMEQSTLEKQQASLIRRYPSKKLARNFVELRQTSLSVDHADYLCGKIMEELMRRGHQHLVESERVRKDIPPSALKRQGAQYFDD